MKLLSKSDPTSTNWNKHQTANQLAEIPDLLFNFCKKKRCSVINTIWHILLPHNVARFCKGNHCFSLNKMCERCPVKCAKMWKKMCN